MFEKKDLYEKNLSKAAVDKSSGNKAFICRKYLDDLESIDPSRKDLFDRIRSNIEKFLNGNSNIPENFLDGLLNDLEEQVRIINPDLIVVYKTKDNINYKVENVLKGEAKYGFEDIVEENLLPIDDRDTESDEADDTAGVSNEIEEDWLSKGDDPDHLNDIDEYISEEESGLTEGVFARIRKRFGRLAPVLALISFFSFLKPSQNFENEGNQTSTKEVKKISKNNRHEASISDGNRFVSSLSIDAADKSRLVVDNVVERSKDVAEQINEIVPGDYNSFLAYLESKPVWSLFEATRVGLVLENGEVRKGFDFVEKVSEDEKRQNWKVKSIMLDSLKEKKGEWTKNEIQNSNCCYIDENNKLRLYPGYYLDRENKVIVPVNGKFLNSLDKWSKRQSRFSGLLTKDNQPVVGFKFLEPTKDGEKRSNWKIVREKNELNTNKSLRLVEKEIVDMWGSYKKGEINFKYFDRINDFKYLGETTYKGKRDLKKIQKLHDNFRKNKGDKLMNVGEEHSVFPMNSMFRYEVINNKYANIKTPEEVYKIYLENYSSDMKRGFDAYINDLSEVSDMSKLLSKNDDKDYFYKFIVAQVAQESGFDEGAKSKVGANGIAQITEPATTDIHNLVMSNNNRKVNFGKYRNNEGSKEIIRMLTFYDLLLKRVPSNYAKEFEILLKDERLFKEVVFPILVTGYNQGHLNARSIFDFLIESHNSKSIPKEYYVDGKRDLINLKGDVALYLLSKSYKLSRSKDKDLGKIDKNDIRHQSVLRKNKFGEDGVSYYIRISSTNQAFGNLKIDKNTVQDKSKNLSIKLDVKNDISFGDVHKRSAQGNYKFLLNSHADYKYIDSAKDLSKNSDYVSFNKIGEHFAKYIHLAKKSNGSTQINKLPHNEKMYELNSEARWYILKEALPILANIGKEFNDKTGKYIALNSHYRSLKDQLGVSKDPHSFHRTGRAVDLRKNGLNKNEQNILESILSKYAKLGYITVRVEGSVPHYHIVFHPQKDREVWKSYMNDGNPDGLVKNLKKK